MNSDTLKYFIRNAEDYIAGWHALTQLKREGVLQDEAARLYEEAYEIVSQVIDEADAKQLHALVISPRLRKVVDDYCNFHDLDNPLAARK